MASSSRRKVAIATTGPKVSVDQILDKGSTFRRMVGSKKFGPRSGSSSPPSTHSAPWPIASSTFSLTEIAADSAIKGPIFVSLLKPAPTWNFATLRRRLSIKFSSMSSWMINLSAQTHVWPAFLNFDAIAAFTACSISASSKTINGALPPSSRDKRFTVSLLSFIRSFPTAVDPVKLIFFTAGFMQNSSPTSGVVVLSAMTS
mmetsp:Transcript_11731/g.17584  ORF Transcript_11731/g.17584 Transcript_11731/m.17584 type:complete len:202 (+) Transcript_11731:218-823(+)